MGKYGRPCEGSFIEILSYSPLNLFLRKNVENLASKRQAEPLPGNAMVGVSCSFTLFMMKAPWLSMRWLNVEN
jgi:hypothetical protein